MANCHGCKWLDETRPAGSGYCSMVVRSKLYNHLVEREKVTFADPGMKVRRPDRERCELYEPGCFATRFSENVCLSRNEQTHEETNKAGGNE